MNDITKAGSTGYWTFYSNPKKWQIDRFLETNNEYDTYQVTPWQKHFFKPGQLGVIRVGIDRRTKTQLEGRKKLIPGIYGIVEVISEATIRKSGPDKYRLEWSDKEFKKPIVEIRYLKNLLSKPLLLTSLSNNKAIKKDKYLIRGFQASSMPLEKDAFEEIINLIDDGEVIYEKIEPSRVDSMDAIRTLEEKYKNATPQVKAVISKRIERGPLAQKLKKIAQYKCLVCEQLDQDPHTFKKSNGEYFIEAHHVIQVVEKSKGVLGVNNIITICPNHHRQLHYGDSTLLENNDKFFKYKIDGKEITINKLILK